MTDGQVSTNDDEKIIFNFDKECLIQMVKSLYSGVSGLTTHQTRMDVIGNNIANVNSDGFKASTVTFRDIYYQGYRSATSGRATFAGNNPSEVGYGVQIGSIDKDMSQSGGRTSNRVFDMMLEGDGFFMTLTFDNLNLSSDKSASTTKYTRLGKFGLDSYGNLAASNNVFVAGSRNTLDGLLAVGDDSKNSMNDVEYVDRNGDGRINASDLTYRNVLNLNDLMQQAYNIYTDEYGYMYGYDWNAILAGGGEGDNATPAFGNVVYDEAKMKADGVEVDENGVPVTLADKKKYLDIQETLKALNTPVPTGDGDNAAELPAGLQYRYYVDKSAKEIKVPITEGEGDDAVTTNQRPDYVTLYTALNTAAIAYQNAPTDANEDLVDAAKKAIGDDGGLIGVLSFGEADSVDVGIDGIITVTYAGDMKAIARVDIAMFDNPDGLYQDGQTQFAESAASGEAKLKRPRIDPGATEVSVVKNKVEMSNVNLAQEFSDMIVTQRGFQANARIITTSDSMLEELVNLKR